MRAMRFCLSFALLLSACAEFPALEGTISDAARDAPYPTLQPLPENYVGLPVADDPLSARIAALQARAARLRRIDISALQ
ncbi:hypothetical protein [Yoonia sp. BS5-3]|uniref:DUF3035 domain-containing protein n=1 Tax=Yoonia phaeophyticola TaxID=3137369 RepID=A0ABZ2VBN9_9RHOB